MYRVTKNPLDVAAAMLAGAAAPGLLRNVKPRAMPDNLVPAISGAVTYYFMHDYQDTTAWVIGATAGYMGPKVFGKLI